jgi:hypothetical protein
MRALQMRDSIVCLISGTGFASIEVLQNINIPELFKFGGQTVIGVLTIIYLVIKIKKARK